MRIATIVTMICVAGALSGCGGHRDSIEFVAANSDSVLLDFSTKAQGDLVQVNDTATQQCQIFHRPSAVLESLNKRDDGIVRATYLCKGGAPATSSAMAMRHRQ